MPLMNFDASVLASKSNGPVLKDGTQIIGSIELNQNKFNQDPEGSWFGKYQDGTRSIEFLIMGKSLDGQEAEFVHRVALPDQFQQGAFDSRKAFVGQKFLMKILQAKGGINLNSWNDLESNQLLFTLGCYKDQNGNLHQTVKDVLPVQQGPAMVAPSSMQSSQNRSWYNGPNPNQAAPVQQMNQAAPVQQTNQAMNQGNPNPGFPSGPNQAAPVQQMQNQNWFNGPNQNQNPNPNPNQAAPVNRNGWPIPNDQNDDIPF